MISCDSDVRRSCFQHLHHRAQDSEYGTKWRIGLAEAPNTIEVAEQLVRSIEQVNDHRSARARSISFSRRFFVRFAARMNSSRASDFRPSLSSSSPRTLGSR